VLAWQSLTGRNAPLSTRRDRGVETALASGAPRFREPGAACSSYAQPYKGVGVWFAAHKIVVTSPPNDRALYTLRR
jgi:hypothetical protein